MGNRWQMHADGYMAISSNAFQVWILCQPFWKEQTFFAQKYFCTAPPKMFWKNFQNVLLYCIQTSLLPVQFRHHFEVFQKRKGIFTLTTSMHPEQISYWLRLGVPSRKNGWRKTLHISMAPCLD